MHETNSPFGNSQVFFKDISQRRERDIPNGLSRATILEALHNHDLMINTIYPGQINTVRRDLYSTTFTSVDLKTNVPTSCTLTSMEHGIRAFTDPGLGMHLTSHWTIQNRHEGLKSGSGDAHTGSADLYLLEEMTFRLFRPIAKWAKFDPDRSHTTDRIVKMLEQLAEGKLTLNDCLGTGSRESGWSDHIGHGGRNMTCQR
ncbi:uncharacterized protein ACLA_054850 [Aspergillus clavatus NRRL 1]|uniref:Uncharacterized protein n=1 Tax=Aspergillus clavatus (strain ATCC 1007 / CBS 513.65 / DSM 816 / NCTC 3887 / NRRL 1 / QM 1276 / 107) TaxID=344612 RepID=A1C9B4_ASPCL|nr:uncharacterized protein ACLA_054850 [Aspergillus clavatus NRRL 1]EAW13438.1 hypothetical protein ACLA_054850 [Aspergillus clavatus NRRL 1]